jgi:hypothetical protein
MKEEKLSTMMATIMDPTPKKEVIPRSWNTLVEDTTMGNGKLPSAKKLKFKDWESDWGFPIRSSDWEFYILGGSRFAIGYQLLPARLPKFSLRGRIRDPSA